MATATSGAVENDIGIIDTQVIPNIYIWDETA